MGWWSLLQGEKGTAFVVHRQKILASNRDGGSITASLIVCLKATANCKLAVGARQGKARFAIAVPFLPGGRVARC